MSDAQHIQSVPCNVTPFATFDPKPLVATAPPLGCDVCVVVPVRDEEDQISATLDALANQTHIDGSPLDPARYEVILLANNCRDNTATIARQFARHRPEFNLNVVERELPADRAHVGVARRMLMDEACRRFLTSKQPRGIIATTDGDTRVGPTWVAATRAEILRGADAVGGRIMIDPDTLGRTNSRTLRYHLRDVGYRSLVAELESRLDPVIHDPWPRHFQHFGASMAVTAAAYRAAGGLPVRPCLEDVAFHDALVTIDARIRHSPDVRVTTSARTSGRTGFGFAVQLQRWEGMDRTHEPFMVESAAAVEARIRALRSLRHIWHTHRAGLTTTSPVAVTGLADQLALDATWLAHAIARASTFGILTQRVHRAQERHDTWRARWPLVDIQSAIPELRCRLDLLRREMPRLAMLEEIDAIRIESSPLYAS